MIRLPHTPGKRDVLALVGGLLLPLAFAPFNWFPLAVLAPAIVFSLWSDAAPCRAAWRGFLFGLGMFGVGVSWVYVSMHNFGNMPAPLAAFATLLFVIGLSLYPALLGWLQAWMMEKARKKNRITPVMAQRIHILLLLPSLWVLFEWLRGWFLSGFPWLNLGYSQIGWPLAGFSSWMGVYGVSFACSVSAGLLVLAVREQRKRWSHYIVALLVLWVAGWLAGQVQWTRPVDGPLRVALVQGNVPLEIKWNPNTITTILQRYRRLSIDADDAELIIWPEAALPFYFDQIDPGYLHELTRLAQDRKQDFLIGILERERPTSGSAYYNAVVSLGGKQAIYRKQHLVPFGEFLPLKGLFGWLINYLHIPMSDFSADKGVPTPLTAAGQKIGVSICYEDAFGEEVIQVLPQATLLVNVSEDAWFGDSLAPHQRLQMARMRALETGRPMLRAANTGPSAAIDHRGEVFARSPQFETHLLRTQVQPMQGATPYVRTGNWVIVPFMAGLVVFGLIMLTRRQKTESEM